jgi:hypothetical protein
LFALELFAAGRGELVIFGAAIIFGRAPAGFDPAATLEAVQRGVQRTLLDLQNVFGDLLNTFRNGPAVLRLESNRFEDEQIQSALRQIEFLGGYA